MGILISLTLSLQSFTTLFTSLSAGNAPYRVPLGAYPAEDFSIPTDALLILFLNLCKELRDFFGFSKVPDALLFPF